MRHSLRPSRLCLLLLVSFAAKTAPADEIVPNPNVEQQPFVAATQRLMQALEYVGVPLSDEETAAIRAAMQKTNGPESVSGIQSVLDERVLAVVNAFDALIGGRPYKRGISIQEALDELEHNKGTQFDPHVVDVFHKVVQSPRITRMLGNDLQA